jgi:hypothetical protein
MKIIIIIFFIGIIYSQNVTQVESFKENIIQGECGGLLYNGGLLNKNETDSICAELPDQNSFIIRIRRSSGKTVANTVVYESLASDFFLSKCLDHGSMCDEGFMIDIYTDDRTIILRPGGIVKNVIKDAYRQRILSSIRLLLHKNYWARAIMDVCKLLKYKMNNGQTRLNYPFNLEHWRFILTLLSPMLLIMFLSLTLVLYYVSGGIINSEEFKYIDKLIDYWYKVDGQQGKIEMNYCFFCWKTSDEKYTFEFCNHYYHESCLVRWQLDEIKCCPCSYEPAENEPEDLHKVPTIGIKDLGILLGLCVDAFRKEDIYDYIHHNQDKVSKFNTKILEIRQNENEYGMQDLLWIQPYKLQKFSDYRLFHKMNKVFKLMCWIIAFWPRKLLSNKNAKLVTKLINIRAKGASIGKF